MTVMCGAALVYQYGWTALIWASFKGHKDIAIALAEKGADLHIKDNVSDCYLCVYGDDDDGGVSATLITAICIYVYVCVYGCVCMFAYVCMDVCMYAYVFMSVFLYV